MFVVQICRMRYMLKLKNIMKWLEKHYILSYVDVEVGYGALHDMQKKIVIN